MLITVKSLTRAAFSIAVTPRTAAVFAHMMVRRLDVCASLPIGSVRSCTDPVDSRSVSNDREPADSRDAVQTRLPGHLPSAHAAEAGFLL